MTNAGVVRCTGCDNVLDRPLKRRIPQRGELKDLEATANSVDKGRWLYRLTRATYRGQTAEISYDLIDPACVHIWCKRCHVPYVIPDYLATVSKVAAEGQPLLLDTAFRRAEPGGSDSPWL